MLTCKVSSEGSSTRGVCVPDVLIPGDCCFLHGCIRLVWRPLPGASGAKRSASFGSWVPHECLHGCPGHGRAAPLLAGHQGAFVAGWAHFDAAAFALAPAEALVMDPQQRLLLQVGLAQCSVLTATKPKEIV